MKIEVFLIILVLGITACKGPNSIETSTNKVENEPNETDTSTGHSVVFQDSQNNYWFASDGLIKYDGTNIWRYSTKDGLYSDRVRGIQEDSAGNIYFDTGEGINKYSNGVIEKLVLSSDTSNAWELNENDLWFEGNWNQNGVYRWDGTNLYHLKLPKHPLEAEFYEKNPNSGNNPYDVYELFKDSHGNIWIGTATLGACRFDGSDFLWISERDMIELDAGPAPGVRAIVEDNDGYFWFSSNVSHKFKITEKTEERATFYSFSEGVQSDTIPGLANFFNCMVLDNDGNLWMNEYDGDVWRFDGEQLTQFQIGSENNGALLFSISVDKHGTVWVGTFNRGAYKFNGKSFEQLLL